MHKRITCIDITMSRVTALQFLNVSTKSLRLIDTIEKKLENQNAIVQTIKNIFAENKIKANLILVSLPMQLLIVRQLLAPFKDRESISRIIKFEIESLIPCPVDNLIVDFYQIENVPEGSNIIVSCVQKSLVNKLKQALFNIKGQLKIVSMDGFVYLIRI